MTETKAQLYTYDYLERNGRLGNQLFQIAATIGLAKANGGYAYFKPDWEYRKFFNVPETHFMTPYAGPEYEKVDGGTLYYQELHYFDAIADEIKEYFLPSELAISNMLADPAYTPFLVKQAVPTCSVHVRRGDYVKYPQHFPLPTPKYYRDAVEKVLEEEPNTHFYVFSDDYQWCKLNLKLPRATYVEGTARPVEIVDRIRAGEPRDYLDLFAMTKCDRHIMANSTFSWWGSWLSDDDRVIYPLTWFGSHPAVRDIPWQEMIPDSWEGIECT